jgi:uncharacterized beta-barrel protein YwiB (DUF1934 family)
MEKARIKVVGMKVGAAEATIEMETTGTIYEKGNKIFINYIDKSLDEDQETNTYIKVGQEKVTITRYGATTSQLIFEKGNVHVANYETRFGPFEMTTTTKDIQIKNEAKALEIVVRYSICVNKGENEASIFKVSVFK